MNAAEMRYFLEAEAGETAHTSPEARRLSESLGGGKRLIRGRGRCIIIPACPVVTVYSGGVIDRGKNGSCRKQ